MIGFLIGVVVGVSLGALVAGLLHAAGDDEERDRLLFRIADLERENDRLRGGR